MAITFDLNTKITILKGRHCGWRYLDDADAVTFTEEFEATQVRVPEYLDAAGITEYLQRKADARYAEHKKMIGGSRTIWWPAMGIPAQ